MKILPEVEKQIISAYLSNNPPSEIALKFKIHTTSIWRILARNQIKIRQTGPASLPKLQPTEKACTLCKIVKPISDFSPAKSRKWDKTTTNCRECANEKAKIERYSKPELRKTLIERAKRYKENNREKVNARYRTRRAEDLNYKVKSNLRRRINEAISSLKKSDSTMKLVGCSLEDLKLYLERQFIDGMTWDNYGRDGWQIDHIIPCAYFDLSIPENQTICFNFLNLQPLWKKDNMNKNASFDQELVGRKLAEIKDFLSR